MRLLLAATCLIVLATTAAAAEPPALAIIAHRGLLRHAPENTLTNFRACLALRLGFEFDARRCRDGALVCIHDETVDRTTNGAGRVSEMTLAEVRRLDAGSWFGVEFAGERPPTVEQVLRLLANDRGGAALAAADIKDDDIAVEVARLAKQMGVLPRLLFIGRTISEPVTRARLRQVDPAVHTAALANDASELDSALGDVNADWVYLRFLPTAEQMDAVHTAGKRALIAGPTVSGDEPANWSRAASAGVDAVLTDYPLRLRGVSRGPASE